VGNDIWLTTSQDILTAIAAGSGPHSHLIALGYAGWGPGQLEEELMENSWLTIKADAEILFDIPYPERLIAAGDKLGIDISLMSSQTGHA
jgi:putative transcriptional regulator